MSALEELLRHLVSELEAYAPKVMSALAVLLIGWVVGRVLDASIRAFLGRAKVDEAFKDSAVGRAVEKLGMRISGLIGSLVKWFVYLLAILVAIDMLGIAVLETFTDMVMRYLPHLLGGMLLLVVGLAITELIVRILEETMRGANMPHVVLAGAFARLILYLVVFTVSLSVMQIDVTIFYSLLNALFWGAAVGICVGLGIAIGLGLKDYIAHCAPRWFESFAYSARRLEASAREREYERRIKELEEEVKQKEARIRELTEKREADFRRLEEATLDLDKRLSELIGNKGKITFGHGCYRIEVTDPAGFPWTEVFIVLSNNGFKVLLEKLNDKYLIEAHPQVSA